jgi:GTPase SAR1 family protein
MEVSFVGEGGAGKTHLCLALQGELERYQHDDPETVGIETGAWVAKCEDSSKAPVFCRSLDFAGISQGSTTLTMSEALTCRSLKVVSMFLSDPGIQ